MEDVDQDSREDNVPNDSFFIVLHERRKREINIRNSLDLAESFPAKLRQQFKYYRNDFIEAALAAGITMPLGMVEDKSGNIMAFIEQRGPRYLMQNMYSNTESVHFLRSALSLLIVTMAMLWRKIPISTESTPHRKASFQHQFKAKVASWAAETLNMLADASSVVICIHILVSSPEHTVHELTLQLLAQLVSVSDEALNQMLETPIIKSSLDGTSKRVELMHEGHMMTDTLRKKTKNNDSNNSSNQYSMDSSQQSESVNDDDDGSNTKVDNDTPAGRVTCLSFMLFVASQHKNHFGVVEGCAAVILAMAGSQSPDTCTAIAATPSCHIQVEHKGDGKVIHLTKSACKSSTLAQKQSRASAHAQEAANEWAGLRLLVQFLVRFSRYTAAVGADAEWCSVAVTPSERNRVRKAHRRVFHAVLVLTASSATVAAYVVNTLPGAVQIIRSCNGLYGDNTEIVDARRRCEAALSSELARKAAREAANAHGISSKELESATLKGSLESFHARPRYGSYLWTESFRQFDQSLLSTSSSTPSPSQSPTRKSGSIHPSRAGKQTIYDYPSPCSHDDMSPLDASIASASLWSSQSRPHSPSLVATRRPFSQQSSTPSVQSGSPSYHKSTAKSSGTASVAFFERLPELPTLPPQEAHMSECTSRLLRRAANASPEVSKKLTKLVMNSGILPVRVGERYYDSSKPYRVSLVEDYGMRQRVRTAPNQSRPRPQSSSQSSMNMDSATYDNSGLHDSLDRPKTSPALPSVNRCSLDIDHHERQDVAYSYSPKMNEKKESSKKKKKNDAVERSPDKLIGEEYWLV